MGKTKWIMQLAVAMVLSLVAGLLIYQWMQASARARAQAVRVAAPEVHVVAAIADLAKGTRLEADLLKKVPYYKESLPQGHYLETAELVGRVLLSPLAANEPVTETRLAPVEVTSGGISVMVKPGKRAMAVKGNKVLGLAGFIRPGNRVDVAVTLEDDQLPGKVLTKTVLENVPVLATGTEMEEGENGKPHSVDTYTLELTPAESEKLGLAATRGTLHFALRNPTDEGRVVTTGANVKSTVASLAPAAKPAPRRVARKGAPVVTVEVIRGGSTERVQF